MNRAAMAKLPYVKEYTDDCGIRCSNIIELLEAAKDATGEHLARATANIQQQMGDLQRLVKDHRNRTAGE